ncbi:hypothetical protein ACC764_27260 [Rhizobium ruizarguesonis]|jgi:hypothetical protein|uniref:hypothetical protein n=1 Tax=Rhizobium ruizarguesonis TaxID=2081791 RepID=UPI001FE15D80|nr:hypothetical protein [Rhizobium ruizarguesonis]
MHWWRVSRRRRNNEPDPTGWCPVTNLVDRSKPRPWLAVETAGHDGGRQHHLRHVISKTPKNQWYVVEGAKGMRFFCWKRDRPLFGGLHLKLWPGRVNNDWPKTS